MAREVVWTLSRYELICEQGMLNETDRAILKMHIMGASNLQIAVEYNKDVSAVCADIKRFKVIYDAVQKEFPDLLEPRNQSVYRKKKHNN